jgi:hypothetical protein
MDFCFVYAECDWGVESVVSVLVLLLVLITWVLSAYLV